jgi:hypothetical protein
MWAKICFSKALCYIPGPFFQGNNLFERAALDGFKPTALNLRRPLEKANKGVTTYKFILLGAGEPILKIYNQPPLNFI